MSILTKEAMDDYVELLATHIAVSAGLAVEKDLDEVVNKILYTKINSPADIKKIYGVFFVTGDGWRVSRIKDQEFLDKIKTLKDCKGMALHIASKADEGYIQNEDVTFLSGETCVTKDNVDEVNKKMEAKVYEIHGADNIQCDRVTEKEVKNKNKNGENKMNENETKETVNETVKESLSFEATGKVTSLEESDGYDWLSIAKYAAVAVGVVAIGTIAYSLATKENDVIIIDSNDL